MVPIYLFLGGYLCKPRLYFSVEKIKLGQFFSGKDLCVGKVNETTPVLTYTSMDNSCRISYVLCRYS